MEDRTLKIDSGALVQLPGFAYEHKHMEFAKNWMAIIVSRDDSKPGGLERRFMERANYPFYYFVAPIRPGDVIEFGADIVSKRHSTRKWPYREYGVVRAIDAAELRYAPQPNALTALAFAITPSFQKSINLPIRTARKMVLP